MLVPEFVLSCCETKVYNIHGSAFMYLQRMKCYYIKFVNWTILVWLGSILVFVVWFRSILVLLVKCLVIRDELVHNYNYYAIPFNLKP